MKTLILKKNLKYFRKHQKVLNLLLETFEMNKYGYAIIGGFVRRSLLKTPDAFIGFKDFDIVVDIPSNELKHILQHYRFIFNENSNGGFKIKEWENSKFKNFTIDIWSLDNHLSFKEAPLDFKHTLEKISSYAPTSFEDGVYVPTTNKLYYRKWFIDSLKKREICVYYKPSYRLIPKIAARLKYAQNFEGWSLDDNAKHIVNIAKKSEACRRYYKHLINNS